MKRIFIGLLVLGMVFFGKGVYAATVEIGSGVFSATISGEYGEEVDYEAYGVYIQNATPSSITLTLTEDAEGTVSATAADSSANAYGIYSERSTNTINHAGSLNVSAVSTGDYVANAYGVLVEIEGAKGTFTNSGDITVGAIATEGEGDNSDASAYGVVLYDITGLTNSGNITVAATAYDEAYAVGVDAFTITTLTNSGDITVTAEGDDANAMGIFALSDITNLTNSGDITVIAEGNNAYAAGVVAGGFMLEGTGSIANLENTGNITAEATAYGGDAFTMGVFAFGIDRFTNSGDITATSTVISGGDSIAAGVTGFIITDFTNSGDITASASGEEVDEVNACAVKGLILGNMTNSGNITADATAEMNTASAYGVSGYNITSLTNTRSGEIGAMARSEDDAEAYGVSVEYKEDENGNIEISDGNISTLSNAGRIEATATGIEATATAVDYYPYDAEARGVYAYVDANATDGDVSVVSANIYDLNNSGNIIATAESYCYGYAYGVSTYVYAASNSNATVPYSVKVYGGNINLTNSGDITVTAQTVDVETDTFAYGVDTYTHNYASYGDGGGYVDVSGGDINLTNSGNITATATATGESSSVYAYGVSARTYADADYNGSIGVSGGNINNLTNSGNITANAEEVTGGNSDVYAYGVYTDIYGEATNYADVSGGNISNLTNSGNITARATAAEEYEMRSAGIYTSITVYAGGEVNISGGNINNLTNSRNILVTAEGDYYGYAYGVSTYVYANSAANVYISGGNINNLTNTGDIIVTAKASESDEVYAYGVSTYIDGYSSNSNVTNDGGNINNLKNSGDILVTAEGMYNVYAYGVSAESYTNNAGAENYGGNIYGFDNSGNIIVTAEGDYYGYAYGVTAWSSGNSSITDFVNSGDIVALATATDGRAGAVGVGAATITDFVNSGDITARAVGLYEASAAGVVAEVDTFLGTFTNTGNITASGEISDSSGSLEVVGILGSGSSNPDNPTTMVNAGRILVSGTSPEEYTGGYRDIAGIVITGGNVVLSNPGEIRVESNVDCWDTGIEARTLVIRGSANVTLDDKFAITFGSPGIAPELKPIALESGTLDLNDTTLIVRADSRNLKFDTEYSIVENNAGTINGEWALELERGYANKSVVVNWVDDGDRGEGAAVIFSYDPTADDSENVLAPALGGLEGAPIIASVIGGQIMSYSPFNVSSLLVKGDRKSVLLASSGVSDEGLPGLGATKQYKGIWFMPVYTKINDDGIGFDANAYGIAIGMGGKVTETSYFGGYAGYVRSNLDFNIDSGDTEEQDIFIGGLNFMYGPMPWYIRFNGLGYYATHSYKGYTGVNYEYDEKADYNSLGCDIELAVGGNIGNGVRFIPEAGLAYQYSSADSFRTDVSAAPSWERDIKPDDVSMFKALAGLSLVGGIGTPTQFYGSARLEYALSGNEISAVNALVGGTEFDIEKDLSDTTWVLQAGLNHEFGNNWSLEFGLRGDINQDYKAYTGRLFFRHSF